MQCPVLALNSPTWHVGCHALCHLVTAVFLFYTSLQSTFWKEFSVQWYWKSCALFLHYKVLLISESFIICTGCMRSYFSILHENSFFNFLFNLTESFCLFAQFLYLIVSHSLPDRNTSVHIYTSINQYAHEDWTGLLCRCE